MNLEFNNYKIVSSLRLVLPAVLLFSAFYNCSPEKKVAIPDVSNVKVHFELIRFDQELFKIDTQKIEESVRILQKKYPTFSNLFFENILQLTDNAESLDSAWLQGLKQFISDSAVIGQYDLVQKLYPGTRLMNDDFEKSLQFMKYYFPDESEPVFYTLISEFGYANFIFEDDNNRDGLGIGLDFFLGDEFKYGFLDAKNPAFSKYLNRTFNKDHLLKKTWESWLEDRLGSPENGRLLDYIIHGGKKLYALSKLLPGIQDTVLFEYTPEQLSWCNQNRMEMWSYFLDKNLLYSTELIKLRKYVNPSPSSPGMPEQAPGQTGSYIGFHIISAYMKRHPETSLPQLFAITEGQQILNESKFKPRND